MLKFFLIFLLAQAGLFAAELTAPIQTAFVMPWTAMLAKISGTLMAFFDPYVAFSGNIIQNRSNGFGVAIQPGCNAVEACIVLISAMLAFAAPLGYKLKGIALGIVAVQGVNILRIISLFYVGQWRMDIFEFAHLYLWQALIMLDVLVVWLIWVRALPEKKVLSHAA